MSPQELVDSLLGHLLVAGVEVAETHHLDNKSVMYLRDDDGSRLRLEVTVP